jgi:hypothetical protein
MGYLIDINNNQMKKIDKYCNYVLRCIAECKPAIPIERYNPRGKR